MSLSEILVISAGEGMGHPEDAVLVEPSGCLHRVWVTPGQRHRAIKALMSAPTGSTVVYMCSPCAIERGYGDYLREES